MARVGPEQMGGRENHGGQGNRERPYTGCPLYLACWTRKRNNASIRVRPLPVKGAAAFSITCIVPPAKKRLPIDNLKIDRSFVRDIPGDVNDCAIAAAVIGLARTLGLEAIAEGIETQAQQDYLAQIGCSLVQGFLHARPLPGADFPGGVAALEGRLAETPGLTGAAAHCPALC